MFAMRLRLHELLADYMPDVRPTGYALSQATGGKINSTIAARLLNKRKPPRQVHFATLDVLCDIFQCEPSELLARDEPAPRTPETPAVKKGKGTAKGSRKR